MASNSPIAHAAADDYKIPELRRAIGTTQMLMIALGGSIGAGLLVSSGTALSAGGIGSLLLSFAIVGAGVLTVMAALGELACSWPVAGAFYDYSVRFISPAWGFAMGWNYAINWLIVLPFELSIIGVQIAYWDADFEYVILIAPFIAVLAVVGLMGGNWFAQVELGLGIVKALSISAFIVFSLVVVIAGLDGRPALGTSIISQNSPFLHGIQGFLLVFRTSGMAMGGTEMIGLTVAEARDPARVMPQVFKVVILRILFFYLGALLMLGFIISASNPEITYTRPMQVSPFVLAVKQLGYNGFANYLNSFILLALVSMANVALFGSSRALQAKQKVPLWSVMVSLSFGLLAFISIIPGGSGRKVIDWLLSLSSVSNYITWISIAFCHIRLRSALEVKGRSTNDLVWASPFGAAGSYFALIICSLALLAVIAASLAPIGGIYNVENIIRDLLGVPIVLAFWIGYQLKNGTPWLVKLKDFDLDHGFLGVGPNGGLVTDMPSLASDGKKSAWEPRVSLSA